MFEPTIPFGEPELMRISAFQRYLDDLATQANNAANSRLSSLSPSLHADLMRFEQDGGSEALEVLAACVRHSQSVTIHLQWSDKVIPMTVFPQERLVHCPLDVPTMLDVRVPDLRVLHVEPATLRPPGADENGALVGDLTLHFPLGQVLWELALRGNRTELLPEIAGTAAYRVAPGLDLGGLRLSGALLAAVDRLQRSTTNLRDMSLWPGFDRERATRLLNALYLQSGLIVSRTHPEAAGESWFGESWFGGLGR
jgi:hypothetical protein